MPGGFQPGKDGLDLVSGVFEEVGEGLWLRNLGSIERINRGGDPAIISVSVTLAPKVNAIEEAP